MYEDRVFYIRLISPLNHIVESNIIIYYTFESNDKLLTFKNRNERNLVFQVL